VRTYMLKIGRHKV